MALICSFQSSKCIACCLIRRVCVLSQQLKFEKKLNVAPRAFCHAVRALSNDSDAFTPPDQSLQNQRSQEMTKEAIDAILKANERTEPIIHDAIRSYEVSRLGANDPCEDNCSEGKCVATGGYLFGVFDGHGGGSCSRAISRRLYDYVTVALLPKQILQEYVSGKLGLKEAFEWLYCSAGTDLSDIFYTQHKTNVRRFAKHCLDNAGLFATVRKSLQQAFDAMDKDVCDDALPDSSGRISHPHVSVATSGSCGLVAHIRGPNLHIANVGDSIAVLAVCNETGSWTARRLNSEHCIDNPLEVKRIRSEHPVREASTVLRGGRLLGELFPLRAFGDVRYKWSADLQEVVLGALYGRSAQKPPGLDTPPYLKAQPEVFYHKLTPNDKFLILASDGLWELLSPEKVVRLVADHMVGRETLSLYQPNGGRNMMQVLSDLRLRKQGESKRPIDLNSATHVIRHALGGDKLQAQYYNLNTMLNLPPGVARNYRDDITVTIVYFDSDYLSKSFDR